MQIFRELWRKYPWALLLALFILAFTCLDMTQTNRERSELENRPLKTRPKLTWSALMDGGYDEDFDAYINDQFVFRDSWITLKSWVESILLKTENNGVVYGKDGYLFSKYDTVDESRYGPNVQYLNEFFEMYPDLPVTLAVVPNAYMVLEDKLPMGLEMVDQEERIAQIYDGVPDRVSTIDLLPVLRAEKDDYIYYRTDHHWTSEGAYLAAQAYAESKGLVLPPLSELEAKVVEGFYGTNYSKAKKAGVKPDSITYYDIPWQEVVIDGQQKEGLYDLSKFEERDKYAAFLWGNNNFTQLRTGNNLNKRDGETTRVLLIKDSFGNSFAPFLTYLYDEVDVIDLRYVPRLSSYLEGQEYDDVLILYNFESLATDSHLSTLRY